METATNPSMTVETADGVRLVADDLGPDTGVPVICLPGLTRNARDFAHLAAALSAEDRAGPARRVVVLESRGRGRSGRADPSTYTLVQELADLVAAMDAWGIETADIVGTSRGGLLAMLLAATAPERVGRVVLNDIGAAIERTGLARIARSVGKTMDFPTFEALAEAQKAAIGDQFPRLCGAHWVKFAMQLASPAPGGGVVLDYDPRIADAFADFSAADAPPDFWPAFSALVGRPVLVVRGAHSDLLSAATVEAMRRRHRALHTHLVHGEGHAPLLWDRGSCETIKAFLS
jgi:pimeloyl-ACP methyl ester carboxylesterase